MPLLDRNFRRPPDWLRRLAAVAQLIAYKSTLVLAMICASADGGASAEAAGEVAAVLKEAGGSALLGPSATDHPRPGRPGASFAAPAARQFFGSIAVRNRHSNHSLPNGHPAPRRC